MIKLLTFHKVRAGIDLPDDLSPMGTIDSTVLIVQKVFRQDFIYIHKRRKQKRKMYQSTTHLERKRKGMERAKDLSAIPGLIEEKVTWN